MLSVDLIKEVQEFLTENFIEDIPISVYDIDSIAECDIRPNAMLEKSNILIRSQESSCIVHAEIDLSALKQKLSLVDEHFGEILTKEIDARGMTDAECYKKAQLNRSHFNKIKNDPTYHVQKETAFALALALGLTKAEADDFLAVAGYTFSPNSKLDLIVEYCIINGIYDVTEVNQLLYAFDQKLLGAGIRE